MNTADEALAKLTSEARASDFANENEVDDWMLTIAIELDRLRARVAELEKINSKEMKWWDL